MLSQELSKMLCDIVSGEHKLAITEAVSMAAAHKTGYQGFKRMHRYRARDRFEHALCLSNFMVEYCHYEPCIEFTFSSMNIKPSSLHEAVSIHYQLAKDHIEMMKAAASKCIDDKEHFLMGKLEKMIADQEMEAERYWRLKLELENTRNDPAYIQQKSEMLHEKYKRREKEDQKKEY